MADELARIIRIFVSSPKDVAEERRVLGEVIQQINLTDGQDRGIRLEPWDWSQAVPQVGPGPQPVVDAQTPRYDIYLGIMSARFGTPTGSYGSGTEKEFRDALKQWGALGAPWILFYFNDAPPPPQTDEEKDQFGRVQKFRDELLPSGIIGAYKGVRDSADSFRERVDLHLRTVLRQFVPMPSGHGPASGPPLELTRFKETDRSQLHFRSQAVPLVGRDKERQKLRDFLAGDTPFSWWLIGGKAGSGKSRLAFELCLELQNKWRAGFLPRQHGFERWREWRPNRATLIVIDYAQPRVEEVREIIECLYDAQPFSFPIRLLLLERVSGLFLQELIKPGTSGLKLEASQHDAPLELAPLLPEEQWRVIATLMEKRQGEHRPAIPQKESILADLQRMDSEGRPLFAMLAAHSLSRGEDLGSLGEEQLIAGFLRRERELFWAPARVSDRDKNLLALVTMVAGVSSSEISLTRMLEDVSQSVAMEYLPEFAAGTAEQDVARYNAMTGIESAGMLRPLEPDLLGEYFVLEHLKPSADPRGTRTQALCTEAWRLDSVSFASFIHRSGSDFPDHPGMEILDHVWGNRAQDWFVWAGNLFFRMQNFADRGKFERILREYRQILEVARQRVVPDPFNRDPELWLDMIVPDLIHHFGEADRRADAEQAYKEYLDFLQDARPEQEKDWVLSKTEHKLIVFAAFAGDPEPFKRLWPRLQQRAAASSQAEVVAAAAWSAHDFIVASAEQEKDIALAAFHEIAALLQAHPYAADEDTEVGDLVGFREAPLRCANSLIVSCWRHQDVESCVSVFVETVSHLPAHRPEQQQDSESNLPPLDAVLCELAPKGQILADYMIEKGESVKAAELLVSVFRVAAQVTSCQSALSDLGSISYKAISRALEDGHLDSAMKVHECLSEAISVWANPEPLREFAAGSFALLIGHLAYTQSFDNAASLLDQFWTTVQNTASDEPTGRNQFLFASYYLAAIQYNAGDPPAARTILERTLSAWPAQDSLLFLRNSFGEDNVNAFLDALEISR